MSRKDNYSLVLLAGGKSSRMGTNKAGLTYKGQSFTKALISKAETLGIDNIYVSGFAEDGAKTIWDIYPEQGPLGGIHACMKSVKTPYCLVLPVDVPQIPVKVLEGLLSFHQRKMGSLLQTSGVLYAEEKKLPVLLKHGGRRENLIGIYPVEMVDYVEDLIKKHQLSVHGMLDSWGNFCYEADVPEWLVENINTREAYENLLKMSKGEE